MPAAHWVLFRTLGADFAMRTRYGDGHCGACGRTHAKAGHPSLSVPDRRPCPPRPVRLDPCWTWIGRQCPEWPFLPPSRRGARFIVGAGAAACGCAPARVAGAYVQAARPKATAHVPDMFSHPGRFRSGAAIQSDYNLLICRAGLILGPSWSRRARAARFPSHVAAIVLVRVAGAHVQAARLKAPARIQIRSHARNQRPQTKSL